MIPTRREPARLLNSDSTDEFTLRLLESAEFDKPTAHALNSAPARVAARVTAVMARDRDLVVATHVRAVHPNSTIRTLRPETKRVTRAAGIGILLGTSLAAAVVGVRHTTALVRTAPVASLSAPAVASTSVRHARPAIRQDVPAPAPAEDAPSTASSSQPREIQPVKASSNDLGQELALLDAAKAALSSGDPTGAIRSLNGAARLPRRVLAPEATVLRVKALVALNRTAEARSLVKSFVAHAPNSPVNSILRELVAPFEKQ